MKLYLTSYRIPRPDLLAATIGKPLREVRAAIIPNAKDYYAPRAKNVKIRDVATYLQNLGMTTTTVDLQDYSDAKSLVGALSGCDLIWGMGGNTFCLRYEMRRSGFEDAVKELLARGVVYAGESAGALVAGTLIGGVGVELADDPEFAEEVIPEGLGLVPYVVMPHVGNPEFAEVMEFVDALPRRPEGFMELTDLQAVIFEDGDYRIVTGTLEDQLSTSIPVI